MAPPVRARGGHARAELSEPETSGAHAFRLTYEIVSSTGTAAVAQSASWLVPHPDQTVLTAWRCACHAVIRLDGPDGPETAPTAWATAQRLAEAVGRAAARVSVTVQGSSGRELVVRWGQHFERLKVSGFRALKVHLMEEARAHAFAAVVPSEFTAPVGYGRGERVRAETPSPFLLIPVTNIPSYVGRVWKTA